MARASTLQIWQYITAMILVLVLTFHLVERIPGISPLAAESYEGSLEVEKVQNAYSEYWWILAILLVAALFHGLNGLRGMLLEMRQGRAWTIFVNVLFWILFIGFTIYGLNTIITHLQG
ncbi:hypothetical protein [Hyperthermus butylicus]|uniref:Succinate dehydrogenase n=1 Tax=Hyperthermus butylicus (strain DSM 5456 / JCM 9403 / PLM1-5) TaxID=415426 RepID=A2BJ67_HYPBU|nr:hypothetical protein [Hyperthermus butylicus]ABM80028.1 hypothetical protein Hbut_0156 [Hyperthermus butylicus DSM 5456]